jgi:hypothetical protein
MIDRSNLTDKGKSSAHSRLPDGSAESLPRRLNALRRVFQDTDSVFDASADAEAIYGPASAVRLRREGSIGQGGSRASHRGAVASSATFIQMPPRTGLNIHMR